MLEKSPLLLLFTSIRNEHNKLSKNGNQGMAPQQQQQQNQKSNNNAEKFGGEMPEVMLLLINFLHLIYGLLFFALLVGYVTDDERIGARVLVLINCTYIASPTVNFIVYYRLLKHYRKAVVDARNFILCRRSSGLRTTEAV